MTPPTAAWFFEVLRKIPRQWWCTDRLTDCQGRHCALGHVQARFPCNAIQGQAMCGYLKKIFFDTFSIWPQDINDGVYNKVNHGIPPQLLRNLNKCKGPRERVLCVLAACKRKGK